MIDIYGPPGLRTLLRTTFAVTQCSTMYRFWRIHELHGFPSSRSTPSRYTHDPRGVQGVERGEAKGEDLWCGGSGRSRTGEEAKEGEEGEEGVWKVIEGDGQGGETGVSVEAVAIDHTSASFSDAVPVVGSEQKLIFVDGQSIAWATSSENRRGGRNST